MRHAEQQRAGHEQKRRRQEREQQRQRSVAEQQRTVLFVSHDLEEALRIGTRIAIMEGGNLVQEGTAHQIITQPANETERWLVNVVQQQAQTAGIGMPEVGIFDSPEPNAFATGANKNAALVAVSTGLLRNMRREEVEAVLGHEVSHVANGDMVTLTLIQGVMNTFVFFLARVIGGIVDKVILKNERGNGIGYFGFFAETFLAPPRYHGVWRRRRSPRRHCGRFDPG